MDRKKIAENVKNLVKDGTTVNVNVFTGKKVPLPPNIMVFQTFAYLAATELKPATNKVLMLFFASSGYENFVSMDIQTIAEKLEISMRSVSYAIRELKKHNVILQTKYLADRRRNEYYLNPLSSWKGNSKSRKKMLQIIPSNQLSLFGVEGADVIEREELEIKNKKPFLKNVSNLKTTPKITAKKAFAKQYNISGDIDIIDEDTGEIIETIKQEKEL